MTTPQASPDSTARPSSASASGGHAGVSIVMRNVSKFYGEVLGVNRVELEIEPGITSLVGPNGSGKTTLMNLVSGLIRPSEGEMSVLGIGPGEPHRLFREVGYCTQFDSFPRGVTGRQFIRSFLQLHGFTRSEVHQLTESALRKVDLVHAADRKVAAYSKGMRQRIKLAQSIAHEPKVLVLDEPLNGLDPMARAEIISLFQEQAKQGLHVLISSHILHEVDMISDRVILISNGYIVAEGEIRGVRSEVKEHDLQIMVRCSDPKRVATAVFEGDSVTEVLMHEDGGGLHLRTRNASRIYELMSNLVLDEGLHLESVGPADDNVQAVYQYLVGDEGAAS